MLLDDTIHGEQPEENTTIPAYFSTHLAKWTLGTDSYPAASSKGYTLAEPLNWSDVKRGYYLITFQFLKVLK